MSYPSIQTEQHPLFIHVYHTSEIDTIAYNGSLAQTFSFISFTSPLLYLPLPVPLHFRPPVY